MLERPNYDACDLRLKASIDKVSEEVLRSVWDAVFWILDTHEGRHVIDGEDAGRLAQMCVNAIAYELPECLAK